MGKYNNCTSRGCGVKGGLLRSPAGLSAAGPSARRFDARETISPARPLAAARQRTACQPGSARCWAEGRCCWERTAGCSSTQALLYSGTSERGCRYGGRFRCQCSDLGRGARAIDDLDRDVGARALMLCGMAFVTQLVTCVQSCRQTICHPWNDALRA